MAEKVARELGALFKVFGRGFTGFPLAEAMCAVVNVGSLDVFMEGFGGIKDGKAEGAWGMLPFADRGLAV